MLDPMVVGQRSTVNGQLEVATDVMGKGKREK